MASIGQFGTPRPPVDLEFTYFGSTIRVHPDTSDFTIALDFGDALASDDGAFVGAMLARIIHPDDLDEFVRLLRSNRQTTDDLQELMGAVMDALTERPTERPADSSGGPRTTSATSMDAGSLRVQRRFEEQGRPDLADVVQTHREYVQSQAG